MQAVYFQKVEGSPGTVGVHVGGQCMLIPILQDLWDEAAQIVQESETMTHIGGVAAQMQLF